MKTLIYVIAILSLNLPCASAFAGQDRGGGKGIVCRDNQNNVLTVELLDLWEAKNVRGKTIVSSSGNMHTDMDLALNRTKYIFSEDDERVYESLKFDSVNILKCTDKNKPCTYSNVKRVSGGINLPISNDSLEGNLSLPLGCKVEQIVGFEHSWSPVWTLNMDLIEKMDTINLVSLCIHEGVYGLLDTYENENNSERVRRVIGHVMSGGSFSLKADQLKKPFIQCGSPEQWPTADGGIYFMQDSNVNYPKITAYSDSLRFSKLIDFNHTEITSNDININSSITEFYKNLITGNIKIKIQGAKDSFEYLSQLRFEMQSGVGIYFQDTLTGGGDQYAPMENMKCELIQ